MDKQNLQVAVERVFGKRIVNRPDCEELSSSIYKKTKLLISYNTLRRFFDIAGQKNNSSVSKASLDILSRYCEFQSYFEFYIQQESIDSLGKLYKLQLAIIQQEEFTIQSIEGCLNQLNKNEHLYSLMNYITVVAFNRGDVPFLKKLFCIERIFNGEDYLHPHLYFLIQTIGVQVQNHPDIAKKLWESWAKDPQARFYYFELFVDMTKLVQSHYIGIEYYLNHSTKLQDIVFANTLLNWRLLLLNETKRARKQLEKLDSTIDLTSIHPIPAARMMNCKLVLNFKENGLVSDDLLEEVETLFNYFNNETHPFFEHFICEGLVVSKCYQLALNYIQEANAKKQLYQSFYLNGSTERLKILEAYCRFQIGDHEIANQLKEQIKLESLDSFCKEYDSIFFHAIDKQTCSKETIQQIDNLGYSHLFALL
jgi:hypothetical protein